MATSPKNGRRITQARPAEDAILCVFAHPNDESFCCGGTIPLYAGRGIAVDLLTFTSGQHGTAVRDLEEAHQRALMREYELRAAGRVLSVRRLSLLDYVDGSLADIYAGELADVVVREIERSAAETIITFGPLGLTKHVDHVAVHRATVQATQQLDWQGRLFFCLADERVEENAELAQGSSAPTHRIDISDFADLKRMALACHSSQPDARRYFLSLTEAARPEELYVLAGDEPARPSDDLFERTSPSIEGDNGRTKTAALRA
jgi:LmbE family N-acetylglucosaminyl deacetylase